MKYLYPTSSKKKREKKQVEQKTTKMKQTETLIVISSAVARLQTEAQWVPDHHW